MKPLPTELEAKIPSDVMTKLQLALGNLEKALLDKDPQMPNHLRESHRLLLTYPETVHLLDDEEIEKIIDAAQKHSQVVIVAETAKGKGGGKRATYKADEL